MPQPVTTDLERTGTKASVEGDGASVHRWRSSRTAKRSANTDLGLLTDGWQTRPLARNSVKNTSPIESEKPSDSVRAVDRALDILLAFKGIDGTLAAADLLKRV